MPSIQVKMWALECKDRPICPNQPIIDCKSTRIWAFEEENVAQCPFECRTNNHHFTLSIRLPFLTGKFDQ